MTVHCVECHRAEGCPESLIDLTNRIYDRHVVTGALGGISVSCILKSAIEFDTALCAGMSESEIAP
jgi:hypothetical protein